MPFEIIRQDITRMQVDAIVNAANESLLGGGGVDGAIHRAAGPGLLEECRGLGGCPTGRAKITGGYNLPAKYVIHTVGPVWHGGNRREAELLAACYANSLALAKEYACESVAFPMISTGAYGYPKDEALRIATGVITSFLMENDMQVYLVVFGRESLASGRKLFNEIREYIDDVYAEERGENLSARRRRYLQGIREEEIRDGVFGAAMPEAEYRAEDTAADLDFMDSAPCMAPSAASEPDLQELLRRQDEGFSRALLRLIDERGMKDADCYRAANVDRRLFSKINTNPHYQPSKPTVCAFAIALRLNLEETRALLGKAGFALTRSSAFDIILEYFIRQGNYNLWEINEVLFDNDQPLLGSSVAG